jgi:hypothetical protein
MSGRRAVAKEPKEPDFNLAESFDSLRHLLKRASTLVVATASMIDLSPWGERSTEDRARMEGIAYLVEVAIETLIVATEAGDRLAVQLAKREGA